MLYFPAAIHYPMYDVESGTQYFPFKTMSMLASLFTCVGVSLLTEHLFRNGILTPEKDVLGCVVNISQERIVLPTDTSFNISCDTLAMHKIRSESTLNGTNGAAVNGGLNVDGERTALHPNYDPNHHNYSSVER